MADAEVKVIITAEDRASAVLKAMEANLNTCHQSLLKIGGTLSALGGAITAVLTKMTLDWANTGSQIYLMTEKTGMAAETLSALKYGLDLTGGSIDNLEMGFRTMSRVITDASLGQKAATDTLKLLNLTAADFIHLSPDQAFMKMAMAVADIQDPITRADAAVKVFGRTGMDLLPVLANGSKGLADMMQKAKDLGVSFDDVGAKKAFSFKTALNDLMTSVKGLGDSIAKILGPQLQNMLTNLTNIVKAVSAFMAAHPALIKAIAVFGIVVAAAGASLMAMAAAMMIIAAITGVGLIPALIAAGVALATVAGIYALTRAPATPTGETAVPSYQYRGVVSGGPMGSPKLVMAHVGEEFAGVGGHIGGDLHVHIGTLIADEVSQRKFARTLKQLMDEDTRRTSFRGINRGYYYGGSNV